MGAELKPTFANSFCLVQLCALLSEQMAEQCVHTVVGNLYSLLDIVFWMVGGSRVYMYDVLLRISFFSLSPALLAPVGQRLNREHTFTSVPSKLAPRECRTHTKFGDPPCVACVE